MSIKLREREPFRKGGASPDSRHLGNCSLPGSSRFNTAQRPPGKRARSRKREGTEGPSGGALGRRASIMEMVVRGRDSAASSRSPRRRSGLPYPTGRARARRGRGSRTGPPTNQIEGKKLPAFKIHLPPPSSAAGRGAGGVGGASGEKRLGKADGRLPVELSIGSPGSEAATPT